MRANLEDLTVAEAPLSPGVKLTRTVRFHDPRTSEVVHTLSASITSLGLLEDAQACFQRLDELLSKEQDRVLTLANLEQTTRERAKTFEGKLRWLETHGSEAKESNLELVTEEVAQLREWLSSVHDATRHVARFAWFREWFATAIEKGFFPADTAHTQDATD